MRNLPPVATQLLASGQVVLALLVEFRLPQPIYTSVNGRHIPYSGNLYTPGLIEKLPPIKSDFSLSANTMTINWSDVNGELLAAIRNSSGSEKQIDIHLAIIDPSDYSVAHVIPSIYRGYYHDVKPTETGKLGVVFKNHMHKFDRKNGRKTNTASQERLYPGDGIFNDLAGAAGGAS